MHVCMYVCMYVCSVCLYICLSVCLYLCMYVCMHACMYIDINGYSMNLTVFLIHLQNGGPAPHPLVPFSALPCRSGRGATCGALRLKGCEGDEMGSTYHTNGFFAWLNLRGCIPKLYQVIWLHLAFYGTVAPFKGPEIFIDIYIYIHTLIVDTSIYNCCYWLGTLNSFRDFFIVDCHVLIISLGEL